MTTVLFLWLAAIGGLTILTVWRAIAIRRFEGRLRRLMLDEAAMSDLLAIAPNVAAHQTTFNTHGRGRARRAS